VDSSISVLSLNRGFGTGNGTTSRACNVYLFGSKLTFFLPYGLSVGLGVPVIALGLFLFYGRDQVASAITGGFL
jgi:hypothetical protein